MIPGIGQASPGNQVTVQTTLEDMLKEMERLKALIKLKEDTANAIEDTALLQSDFVKTLVSATSLKDLASQYITVETICNDWLRSVRNKAYLEAEAIKIEVDVLRKHLGMYERILEEATKKVVNPQAERLVRL
jgi:hypothetical protein